MATFIKNYTCAHGLPLPGRVPGHRDKVMVLPTDVTKAVVYSKYKQACEANDWIAFGCSGFYELWQQLLPHISVSKPSTDLCFTCQQNNLSIQQSSCLTEEEKQRRLIIAQDHLALARKEREYYNDAACATQKAAEEQGIKPRIAH